MNVHQQHELDLIELGDRVADHFPSVAGRGGVGLSEGGGTREDGCLLAIAVVASLVAWLLVWVLN